MPPWLMPSPMDSPLTFFEQFYPLKVFNSLTRSLTPFVPMSGKQVLVYACGPTVYSDSHLGHARTYLSLDIIRRILTKYFKYDVLMVMNITDVDDKIIKRAAERGIGFRELAAHYEAEYMRDMARLGIAPPDVLTRVTEYIPEVVAFVEKIIENGFAYASNGSVYFDVTAYSAAKQHTYGKLVPENVGNVKEVAEGEGELSAAASAGDKRNACDFALWKASKAGEPSWPSPWGEGRPGWHIECSAMAGDTLKSFAGGRIDIHAGGVDLRFPHHENEIAQSEACFNCPQWVNYWLHTGHLHIDGLKMSKSLKNFITIAEILELYTARQLRLWFLLQRYNRPMVYSEAGMSEAVAVDRSFNEFFLNIKAKLRSLSLSDAQKWGDAEKALAGDLMHAQQAVRVALCDDFNTPDALTALSTLMRQVNVYLRGVATPPLFLLSSIGAYVTEVFDTFGLVAGGGGIGFGGESDAVSKEAVLTPVLDVTSKFRDTVRACAKARDLSGVLAACDQLRDSDMLRAGVRMEDTATGPSVWKLVDPEVAAAELLKAAEDRAAKEAARAEAARAAEAKRIRAALPPQELFRSDGIYSAFDERGVPTHDDKGKELSKGQRKALEKKMEAHVKAQATAAAAGAAGAGAGAGAPDA